MTICVNGNENENPKNTTTIVVSIYLPTYLAGSMWLNKKNRIVLYRKSIGETFSFTNLQLFYVFHYIQVPIIIPIFVLAISIGLFLTPIITDPKPQFLIGLAFILSAFLLYIPFVYLKIRLPIVGTYTCDLFRHVYYLQNMRQLRHFKTIIENAMRMFER